MDDDAVTDLMIEIESTVPIERRAEHFEETAGTLATGEHGRASLLVAAAEHRQMRGEYGESHRLLDLVAADGGEARRAQEVLRLALVLDEGDEAAVAGLVTELRAAARADELATTDYLSVGESFELHDRHREALRWFTMPFTYADPDDDDLDPLCLAGRLRVRKTLGMSHDRFDAAALQRFPNLGGV